MTAAQVELLVRLERARTDEARAFVVVTVDQEDGAVLCATGPFEEAEAALAQAGRDHAAWERHAEPGEPGWDHVVVPLWEPS